MFIASFKLIVHKTCAKFCHGLYFSGIMHFIEVNEQPIINRGYRSSGSSSIRARGKIFSTVNGVPLHTAFHYQPPMILI